MRPTAKAITTARSAVVAPSFNAVGGSSSDTDDVRLTWLIDVQRLTRTPSHS
jgi:hypothetical protein